MSDPPALLYLAFFTAIADVLLPPTGAAELTRKRKEKELDLNNFVSERESSRYAIDFGRVCVPTFFSKKEDLYITLLKYGADKIDKGVTYAEVKKYLMNKGFSVNDARLRILYF